MANIRASSVAEQYQDRLSAGALVNSLAMASLTPLTIWAFTFRCVRCSMHSNMVRETFAKQGLMYAFPMSAAGLQPPLVLMVPSKSLHSERRRHFCKKLAASLSPLFL